MTVRVLLVDDHHVMRQGLRALLEKQEGLQVVGEAENGRKAAALVRKLVPQVVVMDVGMPSMNGVEATRWIVSTTPGVKVIGLSMHAESEFVAKMLEAGASGYLLKDCIAEELAQAIRLVSGGGRYLGQGIGDAVAPGYPLHSTGRAGGDVSELTSREREVLQLVAEGHAARAIASELGVSPKTIDIDRANIMYKLEIYNEAGLTKYAIREGVTSTAE